ncbi:unnamed protein product [Pedinophyceae sp. YPF-701]|nr:unnamed protein product [Pedinophyceae sp. YPF-701]
MASQQTTNAAKPPVDQGPAHELIKFLNDSWTPFHAVTSTIAILEAAGFKPLNERGPWEVVPGGKYYLTRNMSALVAFAVGGKFAPGSGFAIIGAHTDSPCLKLKPVGKLKKGGYQQLAVQTYGGGLWHTWFDRDLGLAGRVVVRRAGGKISQELVCIRKALLRIPMLAIHLNRDIHTAGLKPNAETHLAPILATEARAGLGKAAESKDGSVAPAVQRQHPLLLSILAKELGCKPADILDFELHLCDTQPSVIGGACDEFVLSGRLDNLAMSWASARALADTCGDASLGNESGVRCIALFDNEEVGSDSAQGAGSPLMLDVVRRVAAALGAGEEGAVERTLQASFLVSADMAHALHPNYMDKHETLHQPAIHGGLVIKHNANQRYATSAVSAAVFREVGARRKLPVQEFVVRQDLGCGSTIGPILASGTGIRTVDVGAPQLAMHSIREMCGTDDIATALGHFKGFFELFTTIDKSVVEGPKEPKPAAAPRAKKRGSKTEKAGAAADSGEAGGAGAADKDAGDVPAPDVAE